MVDKKLSETESLNYTTEVPVYVAVVKYSDNTEQAITENRKIPLSQFAKDSLTLHNTGNENFTGTKTGQGINTPIALKRYGSSNPYTEIQTHNADGTRTGGFINIQETGSTVNQTKIYVADGSSYKGDISLNYDSANSEVWATLPKISSPYIRKQDNNLDGGQIEFESADNEVNTGKRVVIERNNGNIRILGQNSSGDWKTPFYADIQNNRNYMTNLSISGACDINNTAGLGGFGLQIKDNTDRNQISVYNYITSNGKSYGRFLNSAYNKNCYIDITISSAGERNINLSNCNYAYAPTPSSATYNDTKIATTAFITNKLHHNAVNGGRVFDTLFTGPIGSGNITLSQPYTNYDALMIIGSDDSGNYVRSNILTTKELNLMRSYNKPWALWFNENVYWTCKAESTTSSFIVAAENSRIEKIYGIKY